MKMQVLPVLFVASIAALAPIDGASAKAIECNVAKPSTAQGYWSWRLIDGRKCWYAGKTMISKSSLRWPAAAPAQKTAPDATRLARASAEKRIGPLDAQARLPDEPDSFEARWRARAVGN